ncbi:MAG: complex I NDUFA9 subunit family protein, partial [Alphaproteobacteria bacterium]
MTIKGRLITVFGGSGFIGRNLVRDLAAKGARIRVAVRHPNEALFLKPMGDVGQIQIMQANLRHAPSVAAAVDGADAVVNLVGILFESGKQKFTDVQARGAATVAEAAARAGASRLVHISAIGADPKSPSKYARSKAEGEEGVRAAFPESTILRPSIVFGPDDDFFNRFASLARISPVLPLIGGETRFQPVYVGD